MAFRGTFGIDPLWFGNGAGLYQRTSTATLIEDVHTDTFEAKKNNILDPDFTVNTGGFRIYARNRIYVGPGVTLSRAGNDATNRFAALGLTGGSFGTISSAGGDGENGSFNSSFGNDIQFARGGNGGKGGDFGGSIGKVGGAINTSSINPAFLLLSSFWGWTGYVFYNGAASVIRAGAGGGGGGFDGGGGEGGGGGGGGGIMLLAAPEIVIDGIVTADGGRGADSTGGGGGGGGGGGIVIAFCGSLTINGSLHANGGGGGDGAGGGQGGNGGTGGHIYKFSPNDVTDGITNGSTGPTGS